MDYIIPPNVRVEQIPYKWGASDKLKEGIEQRRAEMVKNYRAAAQDRVAKLDSRRFQLYSKFGTPKLPDVVPYAEAVRLRDELNKNSPIRYSIAECSQEDAWKCLEIHALSSLSA